MRGLNSMQTINNEPTLDIVQRTPVFDSEIDRSIMEEVKKSIQFNFRDSQVIKRIPNYLDCAVEKRKKFLFFSAYTLCITTPLTKNDLQKDNLINQVLTEKLSYHKKNTDYLVAEGQIYIHKREGDLLRRRGIHKFSQYQDPRYYIIFFITEFAKTLSQQKISPELVIEYEYFENFIKNCLQLVNTHYPKTSSGTGFPNYLYLAIKSVRRLRDDTVFWQDRKTVAAHLKEISTLLQNYFGEISVFLACCISNIKTDENLVFAHFESTEKSRTLTKEFTQSYFYKILCEIIQNKEIDNHCHISIVADQIAGPDRQIIYNLYKELVRIFYCIQPVNSIFMTIAKSSEDYGEQNFVRSICLKNSLEASLNLLLIYVSNINRLMLEITNINQKCVRGKNFKPGYTQNAALAEKKFSQIKNYHDTLKLRISEIYQRLNKLLTHKEPDYLETTKLVIEKTIEIFKRPAGINSLSEQVKEILQPLLLLTIKKDSPENSYDSLAANQNFHSHFTHAYSILKDKPKALTEFNSLMLEIDKYQLEYSKEIETVRSLFSCAEILSFLCQNSRPRDEDLIQQTFLILEKDSLKISPSLCINTINLDRISQVHQHKIKPYLLKIRELLFTHLQTHQCTFSKELTTAMVQITQYISCDYKNQTVPIAEIKALRTKLLENQCPLNTPLVTYFMSKITHTPIKNSSLKPSPVIKKPAPYVTCWNNELMEANLATTIQTVTHTQDLNCLRFGLYRLQSLLKSQSYTLYGGGEKISKGSAKVKVPKHIKQMLDIYEHTLTNPHINYYETRDRIFAQARQAATDKPLYFFKLINVRNKKTQTLYNTMIDAWCEECFSF